ncbi:MULTISPECIES: MarR family winged helix-turn-helix transcriptional regulator [Microbacterium]|uniref:MarR family transcriptional regulator n=1 Tax=Microbacterium maritypicum TaxID=33918 RepID=A0ACD4B7U0_MICMQ|nr:MULTISPECIES: MarR family transcriptional regulator [Microbacterium]EYT57905.1 MarR family transcriptional regulator [Microbacterium sp. UCD-TDU]MBP5803041.1 MarR family transcriptional regulator [Microbacterium liquefaciens]UTT53449.1 MarR family transcriptional regulator [Microbacterium liquefaciens]
MDVKRAERVSKAASGYDPSRRHDAGEIDDGDIRSRVQQLTMRQQRFERSVAKQLELDAPGLEVLDHLISRGPATPTELAHRIEISTAAMTLVLNRLEDRGHVRRDRHPSDGRKLIVTASDDAAADAERLVAPLIDEVEAQIAAMSAQERATVATFLDGLIGAYDRSTLS